MPTALGGHAKRQMADMPGQSSGHGTALRASQPNRGGQGSEPRLRLWDASLRRQSDLCQNARCNGARSTGLSQPAEEESIRIT
jgi:hypothetical protein